MALLVVQLLQQRVHFQNKLVGKAAHLGVAMPAFFFAGCNQV